MEKFADFIIRKRLILFCIVLLGTLFFASQLRHLKIHTSFDDLLPQNHPYIKLHNKFRNIFGGANQVLIMLEVKDGDIFNVKTLEKIKYIEEKLMEIPGVDPYKVMSLASRKMKEIVRLAGTIRIKTVMFPDIPKTKEALDDLRWRIYGNDMAYGPFVSYDTKNTLIKADFFDDEIDYSVVFKMLSDLRREVEDENTIVSIAGTPMHYGYVWYYSKWVIVILTVTVLAILLVLYLYFRSLQGVVVPFISGLVSGIWGLGIMSLLGYNLDPLILVLPFLLALMTIRHAMQKLIRYTEEYMIVGDGKIAARNVVTAMFAAGITGIITDSFGISLVAIAAIPILQKAAIVCALWAIPTLIIALLFTPVLLSFIPPSSKLKVRFKAKEEKGDKPSLLDRILTGLGNWVVARGKWYVVATSILLIIFGFIFAERITVGNVLPGSSILWPFQRYNQDASRIARSMPLLNPLYIIVEGDKPGAIYDAGVIREVYNFTRYLNKKVPGVIFSRTIMGMIPSSNTGGGEGDPHWEFMVSDDAAVEGSLNSLMYRGGPGTWDRYITMDLQHANIFAYCASKSGRLIEVMMASIKQYFKNNPTYNSLKGVKFRLAAGVIGVEAAVNEVIASAQFWNLTFALLGLFIFCTVNFRSFTAGFILTLPLAISNLIGFALMSLYGVGLTVSTYPVSSVAIGLGVDYGIYFISRLLEEKKRIEDLNTAILRTMTSNGKAIIIIATTLTLGLALWLFSSLRFQAEMGVLLAILLLLNMLGALLLIPSMVALLKPKFVIKVGKK